MKKLSMLLVLCAAILPLGAIETNVASQVVNVSAPHGFSIAQGETLTVDSIKAKSGASGEVTVSQAALNAVNATGSAGIIVNLPIAINGGNYNIVVAKAGSNVATNGTTAIYAANFVADANIDIDNAIALASVKAYDLTNGYTITNQVSVVDNGNTITFSVNGVSKQINVANRDETKKAPTTQDGATQEAPDAGQNDVTTPDDQGTEQTPEAPEGVTIDANDLKVTPEVAKKIKAESELANIMGAKGTDTDGTPLNITPEVAPEDFSKIRAGTEGEYIIKFTATTVKGEKVSTSATLIIKEFTLENQQGQVAFISANNKLLTTSGVTGKVKTLDDLKDLMEVKATVSGKDALAEVKVSATDDAELLKGTVGSYEVTFEIKGKDAFNSAKTTVILTVVSDDTPITPDGKGFLTATNFLITTDEANKITSLNDYITIHSVQGTYDGNNVLIDVNVPDNVKIVAGAIGIFDVNFTLDGDGDTTTTEDQVKLTKKLTSVVNSIRALNLPSDIFDSSAQAWVDTNKVYSVINYTKYTKEQRIEGKFSQFYALNKVGDHPAEGDRPAGSAFMKHYTTDEAKNLTYEQYIQDSMSAIVAGENGHFFDPVNDNMTLETYKDFDQGDGGVYGVNRNAYNKIKEYAQKDETGIPSFGGWLDPMQEFDNGFKLMINGQQFGPGLDNSTCPEQWGIAAMDRAIAPAILLTNPNHSVPPKFDLSTPTTDQLMGLYLDKVKITGFDNIVVNRSSMNDTSVDNLSKLSNTQVYTTKQEVSIPQRVTLNPATVPAYGNVEATFTYDDASHKTLFSVYPDNAVLNNTKDGYVAAEDNMVTQGEFVSISTAEQFFSIIGASSATKNKEFANPTVKCDKLADLKAGKVGAYTLTLENADKSASKVVLLTIRPNKSVPTKDNKGYIAANGSYVTQAQAKQITDINQLPSQNNVSAIYCGKEMLVNVATDYFADIQAGKSGVYPITYSYDVDGNPNTTDDATTITVNLAVAPEGSHFTGDGLGFIYAEDATIYASEAQALTDINELIPIHHAFAFYGENEEKPVVVNTDFKAIQSSTGGQYQVTFMVDGGKNPITRELQPNQAEISVVLTVINDLTQPQQSVTPQSGPVVAKPTPHIPTGVKNAVKGLGLVVVIATAALVIIKRNRK